MRSRSSLGFWLLVLMALGSLAANFVLVSYILRQYEIRLAQQIWPPKPPKLSAAARDHGRIILLMGDSRISEWGTPALSNAMVFNTGIRGATTAQILQHTTAWLEELHPDVVVIQVGINDLKFLGLHPELASSLVPQVFDNLSNIVAQCSERGSKVVLLETWPAIQPSLLRRLVWSSAIGESVTQLNARLHDLKSVERGVFVVDVLEKSGLANDANAYRDMLHLQPDAYAALTSTLEKELAESVKPD